ncbi:MAG: 2-oxo acid dehydrogenase subunit E2 [Deltaproteobacteria bacterium]|nr:2-oxo acid dehydrogenase subunit E2 [Deltaproteobacteria bacterium]
MPVQVAMPKWGLTMKEGKIVNWLIKEGDPVKKGQDLFEVETEKITNIVEALADGILFQIVVPVGTVVKTGTIVALITEPGEQAERIEGIQVGEAPEGEPSVSKSPADRKAEKPEGKKGFVPATPSARRIAKELGVDLTLVTGSGPGGRVTEKDVTRYHEEGPPPPKITPLALEMAKQAGLDITTLTGTGEGGKITQADVEKALSREETQEEAAPPKSIPFTGMRKAVADNMYASLQQTAQLTTFTEVDVTEMVGFRNIIREEYKKDDIRISYNDIIILAVSRALKRYPIMNSTLVEDEILLHDSVNMGIAVALDDGLIVPVLRDADKKGLLQIAKEARILAKNARGGNLSMDEVTGGTFTISNVSMFQVDGLTPILKPPETGILGIGRVKEKPAVHKGEIAIRSMMFLSLTFDHRVVDGAPANAFLETAARYLEHPNLIMS